MSWGRVQNLQSESLSTNKPDSATYKKIKSMDGDGKRMKRKISIVLFGISFLIAILGEVYLLNALEPQLFSILLIGAVIIVTGYLFFGSVGEYISDSIKRKELLWEEIQRQEAEKWDARYTELLNLQKATYAALKKSDVKMEGELKELSEEVEKLVRQQNRIMEGQKRALNISVNHSRAHTKTIIETVKEECGKIKENSASEKNYEDGSIEEKAESEIKPLYEDPNAALSTDEIASLFKNYGK